MNRWSLVRAHFSCRFLLECTLCVWDWVGACFSHVPVAIWGIGVHRLLRVVALFPHPPVRSTLLQRRRSLQVERVPVGGAHVRPVRPSDGRLPRRRLRLPRY